MPKTKVQHPADDPLFLADFTPSASIRSNLRKLAAEYASLEQQRIRDQTVMNRRSEVEYDLTKGVSSSAQVDRYALRKQMQGIETTISAIFGWTEGARFRRDVLQAYGLQDGD